jgi:hypothetical protein
MINPVHPEVERVVHHAIHLGDDRALACGLVYLLDMGGHAPPFESFTEQRIAWILKPDTREDYRGIRKFLNAYGPEAHAKALPIILSRRYDFAKWHHYGDMPALFKGHTENQRLAAGPLLDMLASSEEDWQDFSRGLLREFDSFTEQELKRMDGLLRQHADDGGIVINLMEALSRMGDKASPLESTVLGMARSGKEHIRDNAWGCLANIAAEPAMRKRGLENLIRMIEETLDEAAKGQQYMIWTLGRVWGHNSRVGPYLRSLVDMYVSPTPGKEVTEDSAKQALWGLARLQPDDETFALLRELLRQAADDPRAQALTETVLWCLNNDFEDRFPEARREIRNLPVRVHGTFAYRNVLEALRRRDIVQEVSRHEPDSRR